MQCQGVGGPCWSFQPTEHLPLAGVWGPSRLQDNIQGHRRKSVPPTRSRHFHQCLQEGMAGVSCSLIQSPLPNSVTLDINLFLKGSLNSATILLEVLDRFLSLSWLQFPHLQQGMSNIYVASLLGLAPGRKEMLCMKILNKK